MADKVRVGIVRTSWWAKLMYLPSLQSHPGAEIVAICGRDRGRTEALAQTYGIPPVFTDYGEAIERGNLQALIISTPDDLLRPIALRALEADLHVLCEKPLANSAYQAKVMWEKAEAAGVKHMVLFTWRWMPHFAYRRYCWLDSRICRNSVARMMCTPRCTSASRSTSSSRMSGSADTRYSAWPPTAVAISALS